MGVREELLVAWLGERLITRCIEVQGDLTMPHVQQIIECLVPDVPLEVTRDTLTPVTSNTTDGIPLEAEPRIKVIDRDAFALGAGKKKPAALSNGSRESAANREFHIRAG